MQDKEFTPEQIKKLRRKLKMSRRQFGIKISQVLELQKPIIYTTIYRWESGRSKPHDMYQKALNLIQEEIK